MTDKLNPPATLLPILKLRLIFRFAPCTRLPIWMGANAESDLSYPGEYPFTRGVQATMYRGRLWTMRQYAGMGDAEESNKRYEYLLANGTTGLRLRLICLHGFESDHPLAVGEVGKVGVAIDSIEDMQRLFEGIDLTKISTSMTINATASILLALYVAVARRQGTDIRKLSGTVQNDVLKEYIARGTIYPPQQAMRIITDLFAWTNKNVPQWNTISVSGYHMREAGSSAVQEVAFTLGNGIAYVQAAVDARLDIDKFAPRFLSSSTRTIISWKKSPSSALPAACGRASCVNISTRRILAPGCCGFIPKLREFHSHRSTAGEQIVRTALQALAAVLGGTQSLHTNSYDEALALPTEAGGAHRPSNPADRGLRIRRSTNHRSGGWIVLHRNVNQRN